MTILESNLLAALKPTAVALALFADERGGRVFPSVSRLAWLRGMSERGIQKHLSALRDLGVLVPVTRGTGGRGRTTRYRIDVSALPARASYEVSLCSVTTQNGEPEFVLLHTETVNREAETTNPGSANGEPRFTRFSRVILQSDSPERYARSARDVVANANGNYRVIARIVRDVLKEPDLPHEGDSHFLVELKERTRHRCAKAQVAYSGDVVHRAIDSEVWKWRRKVAT